MTQTAHHRFSIRGRQGALSFELQASLTAPWTVLFGPSGSGKSSILRALAGVNTRLHATFERADPPGTAWTPLQSLPPEHRRLALSPQHALLWPHRTAAENILFAEQVRRQNARSPLPELAEMLEIVPLLPKRPEELSGGERQRISLARALAVPEARLLLLDEPFAGLDRTLRDRLVPRLRAHLNTRALPVLSVTHDPDEVLLLGAEVVRIEAGRLVQQGSAEKVLADELARLRQLLQAPQDAP